MILKFLNIYQFKLNLLNFQKPLKYNRSGKMKICQSIFHQKSQVNRTFLWFSHFVIVNLQILNISRSNINSTIAGSGSRNSDRHKNRADQTRGYATIGNPTLWKYRKFKFIIFLLNDNLLQKFSCCLSNHAFGWAERRSIDHASIIVGEMWRTSAESNRYCWTYIIIDWLKFDNTKINYWFFFLQFLIMNLRQLR